MLFSVRGGVGVGQEPKTGRGAEATARSLGSGEVAVVNAGRAGWRGGSRVGGMGTTTMDSNVRIKGGAARRRAVARRLCSCAVLSCPARVASLMGLLGLGPWT